MRRRVGTHSGLVLGAPRDEARREREPLGLAVSPIAARHVHLLPVGHGLVGSGGCPTPGANTVVGSFSSWGLCACLRHAEDGNVGVKHWGNGPYCAETVCRGWGLGWGLQVLRPRGGSDHRSLSPVPRNSAARDRRGAPLRNGRQDETRRVDSYRGSGGNDRWRNRGNARGDWGDDRRMIPRQEVGDKCVSILRGLGGVADLQRLVERWSSLYPRYSVSRDGQVVPFPMLYVLLLPKLSNSVSLDFLEL